MLLLSPFILVVFSARFRQDTDEIRLLAGQPMEREEDAFRHVPAAPLERQRQGRVGLRIIVRAKDVNQRTSNLVMNPEIHTRQTQWDSRLCSLELG